MLDTPFQQARPHSSNTSQRKSSKHTTANKLAQLKRETSELVTGYDVLSMSTLYEITQPLYNVTI